MRLNPIRSLVRWAVSPSEAERRQRWEAWVEREIEAISREVGEMKSAQQLTATWVDGVTRESSAQSLLRDWSPPASWTAASPEGQPTAAPVRPAEGGEG